MTSSDTGTAIDGAVSGTRTLRGAVVIAAALAVGQVIAYLQALISTRVLGPDGYGALASMLALLLVGNVLALGIQAAGARRIVLMRQSEHASGAAGVVRAALIAGIIVTGIGVALSPILSNLLHLSGPLSVLLVAANLYPMTLFGGLMGVTQGRESMNRFAILSCLGTAGRAIGGIIGVVVFTSVNASLIGMLIGSVLASAVAWLLTKTLVAFPAERLSGFRTDITHATHALFALFALTNLDVLLARHFLTATEAGMYAAGAVVAKVTFWLPQFVAMVAYPRLADHRRAKTLGLGAIAVIAIGMCATAVIAAVPNLVVTFVGGSAYTDLASEVWVFAAAGSAYALAQFLLYGQIAASKRAAIVVLWVAVAALITLVILFHSSVLQIALIVLAVALTVAVIGLAELFVERSREAHGRPDVL